MQEERDLKSGSEGWLVYRLWATSTRTSALAEAALAGGPLTLPGLGLLENVNDRPGITIAEITRRVPQTQQTVSQVAGRLEKLGFIERRLVRGKRGIGLFITASGASAREEAHATVEAFESWLESELGEQRHRRLVNLLEDAGTIIRELQPEIRPVA